MHHTLNINGKQILADNGETLVDAALCSKILIPHDCASGQCETCRVRIAWGAVDDAGTAYGDTVLACQARVTGDATITYETAPPVETVRASVESITSLSHDVVELTLRTKTPISYRPGQYGKLALAGFPTRDYSFSAPMQSSAKPQQPDRVVFQIKRFSSGIVSGELGKGITVGHRAKISGPYGNAYLRQQETGPLILTSTGTGFAPIWSLARAVTLANDNRPMTLVTGIRSTDDLYMKPALDWLADHNQNRLQVVTKHGASNTMLAGEVDQHLPTLDSQTSIHVAGNPGTVERVRQKAKLAQARCYCDPFTASNNPVSWRHRFRLPQSLSNILERQSAG